MTRDGTAEDLGRDVSLSLSSSISPLFTPLSNHLQECSPLFVNLSLPLLAAHSTLPLESGKFRAYVTSFLSPRFAPPPTETTFNPSSSEGKPAGHGQDGFKKREKAEEEKYMRDTVSRLSLSLSLAVIETDMITDDNSLNYFLLSLSSTIHPI